MIEYNERLIPDVGNCFDCNGSYKLTCSVDEDCKEVEIGKEIVEIFPNQYIIDNKFFVTLTPETKKNIVSKLFSNDDQIAIILNVQIPQDRKSSTHQQVFDLMQSWRGWISDKIEELREEKRSHKEEEKKKEESKEKEDSNKEEKQLEK